MVTTLRWVDVEDVLREWDDEALAMVTRRYHVPTPTPPPMPGADRRLAEGEEVVPSAADRRGRATGD